METSGLKVGRGVDWARHLLNEKETSALCGAEVSEKSRELTVLDLPWLGCDACWEKASPRIRVGLLK